nr:DNA translocase FtsK 4TM domain-containing protein [Alginatibacterium sediminis]
MEAFAVIGVALSLFILIALLSFHPDDPSWSQTAWRSDVGNAAGNSGAWLADILFFMFGICAYGVPALLVLACYKFLLSSLSFYDIDFLSLSLRLVGLSCGIFSFVTLASINVDDFYYFSSGGLMGDMIAQTLIPVFGLLGTIIVLLAGIAVGVTLFTGLSWIAIVEWIGEQLTSFWFWCLKLLGKHESGKLADAQEQLDDDAQEEALKQDLPFDDEGPEDQLPSASPKPSLLSSLKQKMSQRQLQQDAELDASPEPSDQEPSISNLFASDDKQAKTESLLEPTLNLATAVDSEQPSELNPTVIVNPPELQSESMGALPGDEPAAATRASFERPANAPEIDQAAILNPPPKPKLPPLPDMNLLDRPDKQQNPISEHELEQASRLVEAKLLDFNVQATVVAVHPGPVITRFELDLAPGIKVSKISGLSKDLARALSAISVRVVEVIPGKSVIGLELPNRYREIVYMREVIDSEQFHQSKSPLTMVLGKDIAGDPVVVDLAKMPHLLVAGTTGSGKSVGVNTMIVSLLYKSTPADVRLIMIDPKMLELSVYEGIPHLLAEVVTDMKEAANSLRWCVGEMERRYKLMSAMGVRNLKGYNAKIVDAKNAGQPHVDPLWKPGDSMDATAPLLEKLPHIVVVIDEFADMMMIVGKKVEELIARIAQKARAAGIHLILATQRPSVDVITGLIKANIPTRMAFQVSSKIDSRTILDQQGAETLLGMGDMLYLPAGTGVPTRVHGAFVDDHEVHAVVAAWKERGAPNYIDEILNGDAGPDGMLPGEMAEADSETDELFDSAVAHVTETRRGSVSGVQRKFKIGYNRAARIVEQMEAHGIVSAPGHNGNREVIAPPPVRVD